MEVDGRFELLRNWQRILDSLQGQKGLGCSSVKVLNLNSNLYFIFYTINRKRKQLEISDDPYERRSLRTFIKKDENILKQQKEAREKWKKEYGTEFII